MLENLIEEAKKDTFVIENVEKEVEQVARDSTSMAWAMKYGLRDKLPAVRDLALSILERFKGSLPDHAEGIIHEILATESDKCVKYRAAFVLASHNYRSKKTEVIKVLREALDDEDLCDVARKYLRSY